ncbi:MAG TPA: lipopolysaccharide heptosyltransferase II [Nitrospiraceae bacterium]|jgi:heptosyltransferase-2|nr:lipopolysaccharide heptosyltransferase II [Nitrospiraceae bacterium]
MSEKILVRGVNWIGDAVMTMPALRALKKAYLGSKLALLLKPSVSALFETDPFVDEIILYENRFKGFIGKIKLARILRKKGFSKAVLFQNAFDAALAVFLAGIPERIGYDRDGRGLLLTKPIRFHHEDRKLHHIEYYLDLLRRAGIKAEYSQPWIYLSLEERLAARERLSGLNRPILGINPGAAYGSSKRWFPERFAEVANWFMKDTGGSVVIFGGKDETSMAQEIDHFVNRGQIQSFANTIEEAHSLLNLAGKTSLRELVSCIAECDVLITNDSGPMHIAYAVGTPLVAIFGSTAPELTGPVEGRNMVMKHDFACSPCFARTCATSDMRCMYSVTADDVYIGVKKLLPDKKAVFFDRDGTLCNDADYLGNWNDFKILPGVEGLGVLKNKGYSLFGVTNQSGIARGVVDEAFVKEVNQVFIDKYGFDGFYYCPHHPDEHCLCRKPEPGMVLEARHRQGIDLKRSYIIGDKEVDMALARAVGAKGILVRTGQERESRYADFVVDALNDAIRLVK